MKILIAEDGKITRTFLTSMLKKWGHEITITKNGEQAWEELQKQDAPRLVILDWMMPKMNGVEVCQKLRELSEIENFPVYIIILTSKEDSEDIVKGLKSGADDYVIKTFTANELKVRIDVGIRYLVLQNHLIKRAEELEDALLQIKQLQHFLPICSYCKRIRGDEDKWSSVEKYISNNSEIDFSSSLCPDCQNKQKVTQ